jgi:ribokinase
MSPAVVVIGSYVQDLAWRCTKFPAAGETVIGTFALGPGGKGSNQAVAAARAGARTCFIGAVGRDAFADEARRFYRAERIAARFAVKPGHATGTAAILVNARGQNEIVVALGANAALARADLDEKLIRRAGVVVTQLESNLATTAHALRVARRAGVTTVLNPAPMRTDFDPALLRHVDVLIPNESEFVALVRRRRLAPLDAARLARLTPLDLHTLCRALRVPTVIVTLGERGCFVSEPHGFTVIAGHRVKVVDTTGAGDAFVGGFAAGLVRFAGDPLAAARFANVVAALSVTRPGTAPSMPRQPAIARFLRRS